MVISISSTSEHSDVSITSPYPIIEEFISPKSQHMEQEKEKERMVQPVAQITLIVASTLAQNPLVNAPISCL